MHTLLVVLCRPFREEKDAARANVFLDGQVVAECQQLTKLKTHRALIDQDPPERLRRQHQQKILDPNGRVVWQRGPGPIRVSCRTPRDTSGRVP